MQYIIKAAARGSRPRLGSMHPILHSNIFFYLKLFATIISSWNSLKFSDIYLNSRIHVLKMKIQFCQF